jgi:transposase
MRTAPLALDTQIMPYFVSICFSHSSVSESGLTFELWTLERLQTAFQERCGIHLSDSTIWEWLDAEGLEWKRQEIWFHEAEKHDPEFIEKRGASSPLT